MRHIFQEQEVKMYEKPLLPVIPLERLTELSSTHIAKLLNFLTNEEEYLLHQMVFDKIPNEPLFENKAVGNSDGGNEGVAHNVDNIHVRNLLIQKNLQEISKVREKITNGTFGICEDEDCETGLVEAKRLVNSRFMATKCIECKTREEKGLQNGGRLQGPARPRTMT
ncbi:MAG: hypothetical protein ACD_8C00082G0005 [uncultured bacterium]|nr:MAG: hypothetical protein ACD_8C00082G0005 [uncultured bacterium]